MTKNRKNTFFCLKLALFRLILRSESLIEVGHIIVFWNRQNLNNNILDRKMSFLDSLARHFANPKQGTAIETRSLPSAYCGQLDLLVQKIIDFFKKKLQILLNILIYNKLLGEQLELEKMFEKTL
jgi:hypothetical protein